MLAAGSAIADTPIACGAAPAIADAAAHVFRAHAALASKLPESVRSSRVPRAWEDPWPDVDNEEDSSDAERGQATPQAQVLVHGQAARDCHSCQPHRT